MDNPFVSDLYLKFRKKLQVISSDPNEMSIKASEAIFPLAEELNIGLAILKLSAPVSRFAPHGESRDITLFKSASGNEEVALMETYRTGEMGLVTILFHPKKGHKFNDAEVQAIKLISLDLFIILGRSRLMKMVTLASLTDSMTGIPNPKSIIEKGINLLIQGTLQKYCGIFINLKNFNYINRVMGARIGDQGITAYALKLLEYPKSNTHVARLGGDNFFAVIEKNNLDDFIKTFSSVQIEAKKGPTSVPFMIQARMGIYMAQPKDTMNDIMHCASIALGVTRTHGHQDIAYFSPEMAEKAFKEKEISSIFNEAFEKGEFEVYYQPKVQLQSNRLNGSEALVRWNRNGKICVPEEFLSVLENEASICKIDFFVLEKVCQNISEWTKSGINPVRTSVNFSKTHLQNPNLAEDVFAILDRYNTPSELIEIELTEVSDIGDAVAMRTFVTKLRQRGISVAIDDFGTGYSTLNVLKNYDANVIKLDKSLLDRIGENSIHDETLVRNIISLMQELGKEVVAEGVENEAQLEFLKGTECKTIQGFIFDKPLNHDEFQKRLTGEHQYSA